MTKILLTKQYFKDLIKEYKDIDEDDGFQYKIKHSSRVAKNAEKLAISEGLNEELSYIIGLLHDIGRFEQVRRDVSFLQDHIFDHGDCGEKMFLESDLSKGFTEKECFIISKAIKNHNKLEIEDGLDDETLVYCKMIRDADKIDIFRVIAERMPYPEDGVSPDVIADFNRGELVRTINVKTNQDHLINMMSFIFDINFESSKVLLNKDLEILKSFCTHIDQLIEF